jgi:hypothetical protein
MGWRREGMDMKIIFLFLALLFILTIVGCVPTESTSDEELIRCNNPSDDDIEICKERKRDCSNRRFS